MVFNHLSAFNTNGIVYDNTPWRPGRGISMEERAVTEEDERRLKNLATRIMSNGVEVLVKDKNGDGKQEQRQLKFMHITSLKSPPYQASTSSLPKQSLLSSAVATVINRQQMSALFPLHQLMKHNYIIKTCMTTYTYLTTVVQNKRSAVSTFETIVSVVTTESLTNLYATDVLAELKPTKTKYMEVKTIHPSTSSNMFMSSLPKIEKRIDTQNDDNHSFDLIQPSEVSHVSCTTTSCSCSHTKTEGLKTKYTNIQDPSAVGPDKYSMKTTKYGATKFDVRTTNKESLDKKTQYRPYDYESNTPAAPTDKIVEKYTEVMNDYSDEKDTNSVEESELLTNEQAPNPLKINKVTNKTPEKVKTDKPQKQNKNKFVMAELIKLGSLGIKGLSQLAPVIEKMTGGFMKRIDTNKTTTTTSTTTIKPVAKLTSYSANKRVDSDFESKQNNFPIYIPVDELETSESQIAFTNATLQQNFAWAAEYKQPKAHIVPPKIVHESPLVNGGIPISPGEIITANSDVIVGKPAVGGPLTLAASGIKLQNSVKPPLIDSFIASNDQYIVKEKPPQSELSLHGAKHDDSFDLRPPDLPKLKPKPSRNLHRPSGQHYGAQNPTSVHKHSNRLPSTLHATNDHMLMHHQIKNDAPVENHGRPVFLDYIPSLAKPIIDVPIQHHINFTPKEDAEIPDNNPSSSEIVSTKITTDGSYAVENPDSVNQPFLVDIQPSRVANVLIPHGSSTALVFAGSSEPHKTGDYVDDPLPYPEPGYFGSFSIDAPQMTNVHNVAPNNKHFMIKPSAFPSTDIPQNTPSIFKESQIQNEIKKWKDTKRPIDYNKIPPPTSNQETHVQVGPQITVYDPNNYKGDFEKYNQIKVSSRPKDGKEIIDKEYEKYLAVPPPPPPKINFNQDKNKPYNQRPIVHTKPVQDMKVFLNVQHPVPKPPTKEQMPPKVTSEIYFASQMPSSRPTPTYTVHVPFSPPVHSDTQKVNNNLHHQSSNANFAQIHNSFSVVSSPNMANNSIITSKINEKDNTYTVTLNTATNVASNGDPGQVIGSSVAVPVDTSQNGELNANIPIGTNFAITVEDNPAKYEDLSIHGNRRPGIIFNEHGLVPGKVLETNEWNTSLSEQNISDSRNQLSVNNNDNVFYNTYVHKEVSPPITSSLNSHANFPMINAHESSQDIHNQIKPVVEFADDIKKLDQKRPGKHIPNISTNSHGWYSSFLNEDNLKNINVKVEVTTRKIIPLNYDYKKDNVPEFGQKIASVGKPPTDFWGHNNAPTINNFNIGKPFSKPQQTGEISSTISSFTKKPYSPNYIPSNLDSKQPAYDIPIRDNSYEISTKPLRDKVKPVYENSEEIYDGEEEAEIAGEVDGEVSSESVKVPIITSSSERENVTLAEITTLEKDEVSNGHKNNINNKQVQFLNFNSGTQTEKPFRSYNKTTFQSNTIKPIYENNSYMKPRPFTVNTIAPLDHQLQQPHWQINQLMENSSNISYEENLDLNTGEEITGVITAKPTSTHRNPYRPLDLGIKYNQPPRKVVPLFSNTTRFANESNIITSTVHIQDKKPLVVDVTEKSTLPTFTITTNLELNRTSSEIIDLSPPPPTLDYNFKPSTNDEMIMGMSPPPPRTPPAIRHPTRPPPTSRPILPVRTPPPYRTMPPRTLPPRLPTQRPVRKPVNRDEVSTYRPTYDILNKVKRPIIHRDQPSSQLLPPPISASSQIISPIEELPKPTVVTSSSPNLIFPTPISSGWLTSSGVEFPSSFDLTPTSVYFPDASSPPSSSTGLFDLSSEKSSENPYNYEPEVSTEYVDDKSSQKPDDVDKQSVSKEISTESTSKTSQPMSGEVFGDSIPNESSQEETTTDKMKVIPLGIKNRTRKPYPIRNEDKKTSTSKYKLPSKPTSIIRPTRTLSRSEVLYPTRSTSIRKVVRPVPTRSPTLHSSSIIESSESSIDEYFIKPTQILSESVINSNFVPPDTSFTEKTVTSTVTISKDTSLQRTHHAGNEIKISDEIVPTKTEFKTTVVTLTKTLSEPPKTVSSIGYVNLTHTLTVTHTKTSLISQSEGAVTQTLVLTNTHTSTVVDVVTEIYTQVQPTTIVETVTKHIPTPQPTPVQEVNPVTKVALDDISMSSEESENFIIHDNETTENIQKIEAEGENDSDTFFVVMNKSQNGGKSPPVNADIETGDYDGITRNEQVNSNGVSQVLFGEILLAGTPYLETTNVGTPTGVNYGKECQPDCKASRNERCQRIDGMMKCVCRPGFARMFPDRPCKPTYTYSVKLALGSQGNERLQFHQNLSDNSSKEYHSLALATHEGINRMVMQSDLRDVFHGVHITGFHPVDMKAADGEPFKGVMNDFYVQLSDNAHESRLKEVIEKYLRNNNYSLGGTDVHAAGEFMDKLDVSDFDECVSGQFHDCSEHAQCFNLRGTYTCSCLEGFADLSVNSLYPGRICSAEPVGCERCNYHGACYSRDDRRVLCECFQWYAGSSCHINLKVVLISLVVLGALLTVVLAVCAVIACSKRPRPPPRSIVACIQSMPSLHQGAVPSKQRADRRALISERGESGDASSVQNASLPYMPSKRSSSSKKCVISDPPAHAPPPPPAPAVMIPRARLHSHQSDSRDNLARKRSLELSNEAKLISYLESGVITVGDEMRRKHSIESSYSANKDRHNKQGALVSAGFKVSTTIRPDETLNDRDDTSSVNKTDIEAELSRFDTLRKSYSQEDMSEWTDAERRIGELTLSEARSVGGTLPASTGRAASSTRLTHQEANTMAERDLGSTFLLPHVHLYKPDLTSDVSEFDSL